RECPTGADMGKMRRGVWHHRRGVHAVSRRDRWLAQLPRWARWAARMHGVANLRDRVPGGAWLGEHAFGIASRRSLPRWRRDPFLRRPVSVCDHANDADVVLFVGTV